MKFTKYKCEFNKNLNLPNKIIKTKYGVIKYVGKDKKSLIIEKFKSKKIFYKIFKMIKKPFITFPLNYQNKIHIDNYKFFKLVDLNFDEIGEEKLKKFSNLFFNKSQIEFLFINQSKTKIYKIHKYKTEILYSDKEISTIIKLYKSGQVKFKSESENECEAAKKYFLNFYNLLN